MNTHTLTQREKDILERRTKVSNLYHAGASVAEIARALEVTKQAVYEMLKTLDLPSPTKRDEVS